MTSQGHKLLPFKPEKRFSKFMATDLLKDSLERYLTFLDQYRNFIQRQMVVTRGTNLDRRVELIDDTTKQLDFATAAFRHDIWGITNKCTVKTMEKAEPPSREQRKRKLRSTPMLKRDFLDAFTNDDTDNNDDKDNNDDTDYNNQFELERVLCRKDPEPLNALTATFSGLSKELSCLSSSDEDEEDKGCKRRRKNSQTEENIETAIDHQRTIPFVENWQMGSELNRSVDILSFQEGSRRSRTTSTSSHTHNLTLKCPSSRSSFELEAVELLGDFKAISNAFPKSEPESQTRITNLQSSKDDEILEEFKEVIDDMGKKASKASERRPVGAWKLSDIFDEEPAEELDIEKLEQIEVEFKDFDLDIVEEPIIKEEDEWNTIKEQRDDATESEVADDKVRAVGRRNIRTLLTDEKLTEATREANLREKKESFSSSRSSIEFEAFPKSEPESQTRITNLQSSNDDEVLKEFKEVIDDMGKKASKASKRRSVGAWKLSDTSDEEPAEELDIEKLEQIEVEFKDFDIDIVEEPIIKEEDEWNTNKEQRDDATESEVADAKVRAVGRQNIRTLLTDEKLTGATREANLREKKESSSSSRSSIELEPVELLGDFKAISNAFPKSEPESQTRITNLQSSNDDEVLEEFKEVIDDMGKKASKASESRSVGAWKLSDTSDEEPAEEVDIEKLEQIEVEFKDFDIDIVEEPIIKEEDEWNTSKDQRDDATESEVADAKVRAVGRRNIRTLLTDEKLTGATRQANLREKERLERLEQKRNKLDSSQSSDMGRLVLDATEGSIIAVHPVLFKRLKEHQINGVKFMWDACYESVYIMRTKPGAGCVLAHCMGLGKTFQVVTLIHTLFSHSVTNTRHVLIVCPVSTVLNWQNEFDIGFTLANSKENMNVFIISDWQKDRLSKLKVLRQWWEENGVLIMGYDCYRILTQQPKRVKNKSGFDERSLEIIKVGLVNPGPDLLICDEGHRLKNSSSVCSKALKGINTLRRIILTGTPLQNNLHEYYSMVQFVKPDLLRTVKEFKNRFENPITNGQCANSTFGDIQLMKKRIHVLHSILKDTVQRYEVTELQNYLPEKKEYVVLVKLHEVQAVLYQKYINHFKPNRDTQFLLHFYLLQSIWTHPKLLYTRDKVVLDKKDKPVGTIVIDKANEEKTDAVDLPLGWWKNYVPTDFHNNWDYGPKLKIMIAIVKQCVKHKQKVLIFSSSIAVLDLIEHVLKVVFVDWRPCRDFLRMDGTVAPEQRQKFCNMFNQSDDDSNRVFLISQKVGGVGLNLVAANRVILMDVSWNPAIDTESIFRVYRFGQTRPCYIYRLVSKDTMEEVAYRRSVTKQAIGTHNGRVVDEIKINRHYSLEDLREMYNFDYEINEERRTNKLQSDILLANVFAELKKEIFTYHEHEQLSDKHSEEEA